jgi:hypothetical protein
MNQLINFLNSIGIHVNISESSSPVLLFAFSILVLSLIVLSCILNIILYLCVIYISENNQVILDIISKYKLLLKIFNIYKKTRMFYLVIEFILLLFSLGSIIWLCFRVLIVLITINI